MSSDRQMFLDNVRRWQHEPWTFVKQVFKAEPTEQQQELLEGTAPPQAKVAARSGCGVGKTTGIAWLTWWHVICYPNSKVAATAPTKSQLQDCLVSECGLWRGRMSDWFQRNTKLTSEHASVTGLETQFATFKTSSKHRPEALQGLHGEHVLALVDEASGVDDVVFEPLKGATGRKTTRQVLTANPTRCDGYFYRVFHRLRKFWTLLHLSCLRSPNVPQSYIDEIAEEYGVDSDMYRVRVLGDFPEAGVLQLITRAIAEQAAARTINPRSFAHAPVALGLDVAWEGDDRSCLFLRQGHKSELLHVWDTINHIDLAGICVQALHKHGARGIAIDQGWGVGVIDAMRRMGYEDKVHAINFGDRAINAHRYVNKRTEMWCRMRDWLVEGGVIPHDRDDLIDDLVGPEYQFNPSGKLQLERKKDMKRRGLSSPDLADGLALTFAVDYPLEELPHGAGELALCTNTLERYDPLGDLDG